MRLFSASAPVGQASTHAPQETHSDSRNGSFWLAATRDANPRPSIVSANVPWVSSQARTQREQTMQRFGSNAKYGLLASIAIPACAAPPLPYGEPVTPCCAAMLSSSQCPDAG